jgi:hypothetical protein
MKKEINCTLSTILLIFSINVNALDRCVTLVDEYGADNTQNRKLNSIGTYQAGKKTSRLYLHREDCDDDLENDVNLQIEAIECGGTSFTDAMRDIYVDNEKVFNAGGTVRRDSTVINDYAIVSDSLTESAISNVGSRFCKPSTVDYDGGYNKKHFCDEATNIRIDSGFQIPDIPTDQQTCFLNLDRKIKIGEIVNLVSSNVIPVSTGSVDYYSFGFATVRCDFDSTDNEPYLYVIPNDNTCDYSNPNSSLFDNATRNCNQICYWGQDLFCPQKTVTWGSDCAGVTGVGYVGDEITVNSDLSFGNGSASYRCELSGRWVQNSSGSSCG